MQVHYCHFFLDGVVVYHHKMVVIPLHMVQLSAENCREKQLNIAAPRESHLSVGQVNYVESKYDCRNLHFHSRRTTSCNHCDRTVIHYLGTFDVEAVYFVFFCRLLKTPLHLLSNICLFALTLQIF